MSALSNFILPGEAFKNYYPEEYDCKDTDYF